MRKGLTVLLLLLLTTIVASAQSLAHSNVTPYYDDESVAALAWRESPYCMTLAEGWQQQPTDSSVRYTRQLDAELNWRDFRIFLNVRCGRGVRVYLNGREVGYGDDSRHWNEFLISPYLRYGLSNVLVVEALRQCPGALLEDASLPVGMNGDPWLVFKNDPSVADFSLVADYDAASGVGTLTVSASVFYGKKKGKYYLEVELWDSQRHTFDRMGRWVVFNGRNEESVEISRSWPNVRPWNAEDPNLYTAIIRLRNSKMEEEEIVGAHFGFRRVEVKDGVLQVNGHAVTLRGVTYGPELNGDNASRQQMLFDVENMKRHNINAVRTSRRSPLDAWFYELCDCYGLYVVCDANLMPLSERHHAVATDPDYLPLFEQRVEHLYGSYKNHTSIIAWSLGNSSDNAVCMTAAYKRLKAIDKTRPVVFAGAGFGESTDIIALVQPDMRELRQMLRKHDARPCIFATAVDAAHFANLQPLWQTVLNNRGLQGGFVDVWPLTPVMAVELKHLFRPFDVTLSKLTPDEGEFIVVNRGDFSSLSRYNLEYTIFSNLRGAITGGDLPVAIPCGGSDKVTMRIPPLDLQPGEEIFIRFDLVTRAASRQPWQSVANLTMGTVELGIRRSEVGSSPSSDLTSDLRVPTSDLRIYFAGHEDWRSETIECRQRRLDDGTAVQDCLVRYTNSNGVPTCHVTSTYALWGDDAVIGYSIKPLGPAGPLPLKPVVRLALESDSLRWFGLDRVVLFDEGHSGQTGIFSHSSDGFTRREVRWCASVKGENGLFVEMLDGRGTVSATRTGLSVAMSDSSAFRLHLLAFNRPTAPESLAGGKYPRIASVLQPPPPPKTTAAAVDKVTFSRKASTPYNVGADTILFDGIQGDIGDLARGWLGFAGEAPVITVQLASPSAVEFLTLRFAHSPATWAFAPAGVLVLLSSDGTTFNDTLAVDTPFDPADSVEATTPQVVELRIPAAGCSAQLLRIVPQTLPTLPSWHRARGLKPWLLMDEIEVYTK